MIELIFSALITILPDYLYRRHKQGKRIGYVVGNYFRLQAIKPGTEISEWFFSSAPPEVRAKARAFRIPYFFRTFSDYFNPSAEAGFNVVRVEEPYASEQSAKECPNVDDTRIVPWFMIFQCWKR